MSSHRRLVYVAGLNVEGYWDVLGGRGMLEKQQRIAKDSRPRTKEDEEKKKNQTSDGEGHSNDGTPKFTRVDPVQ